jgi:pyruvate dehydrogenase E1 component alpha subunit
MGTALGRSESETNLAYKAASYEMPAWAVDGMDVIAVADAARRAVTEIRGGGGPVFLELQTYRFRAHSMYDPERYRSKDEVEVWRERDPIARLRGRLTDAGLLADADVDAIEAEVTAEIDDAVAFAEAGTWEPVEHLTRFVYSERER